MWPPGWLVSLFPYCTVGAKKIAADYQYHPSAYSPLRCTLPNLAGMQYLYCMFEGSGMLTPLDNERYTNLRWTGVRSVLQRAM
jgi:hypothetical protein